MIFPVGHLGLGEEVFGDDAGQFLVGVDAVADDVLVGEDVAAVEEDAGALHPAPAGAGTAAAQPANSRWPMQYDWI